MKFFKRDALGKEDHCITAGMELKENAGSDRSSVWGEKMLFMLSDGKPTDSIGEDSVVIKHITSELTKAGVKVVSCFVTRSTDIHLKRLYDTIQPGWESGAEFLFSLSSHVPTQHLP